MELSILRAIQSMAHPLLDALFIGLTMLGEPAAAVVVLTAAYWLWDKEKGEYMAFSLLASLSVNGIIKNLCNFPRPIGQEGVRTLRPETATGSSFPSGHSQTGAALYGAFAWQARKRWAYLTCIVIPLLIALSRLYLGVHWPKDVLAGLLLGFACSFGCYCMYCATRQAQRERILWVWTAAFLAPVILWGDADFVKSYGLLVGFAVGMPLEHRLVGFTTDIPGRRKPARWALGLALLLAVKLGLKHLLPAAPLFWGLEYAAVGFTAFFLCPALFCRLRL